jgi:phospholipid/cholesterol/gamma-HCH transport system ATP-binding protein
MESSETYMTVHPVRTDSNRRVIEITDLSISFGDHDVLKHVSLDLYEGENLVILGRSGCGKSVLIKCIVGLLHPDEGMINIMGKDIASMEQGEMDEFRKKIGFLFQRDALYDSMTVRENLEFPLTRIHKNLKKVQIDEKVRSALDNVGLLDTIDKMPSELSGGMRKRISLARTLVIEPVIMLYDEPTTGLDPATTDEISLLINQVRIKYKTSAIIITHDIRCARTVADRIIVLNEGGICAEGNLTSLERSKDPLIKSFFI